jgi:hypothetical protein
LCLVHLDSFVFERTTLGLAEGFYALEIGDWGITNGVVLAGWKRETGVLLMV